MATDKEVSNQKEITAEYRERKKLLSEILKERETTIASLKEEKRHLEEIKEIQSDSFELRQTELEKQQVSVSLLEKEKETLEQIQTNKDGILDTINEEVAKLQQKKATQEEINEFLEKNYSITKGTLSNLEQAIEDKKEEIELAKENLKILQESTNAIDAIREKTSDLIKAITGVSDSWKSTFIGSMIEASKVSGGFSMAISNIGKQAAAQLTPANMLGSTLMKVQEATLKMVHEQDQAVASFNRAQGAAGAYDEVLVNVGTSNLELGIDVNDAAAAITSLKEGFTNFTMVSKETQQELTTFTATMAEFGVSTDDVAASTEILTRQMNMSIPAAIKAQKQIAATAIELGIAPKKMAAEFTKAAPRLAAFGRQGTQVFRELAATAKATGMEIDGLISIAEKFDTFEGAAEAVGRLNAILGGPFLDSMSMTMMTNPADRIKELRNALDQAGISFEDMSYYQRRAVASAAGLESVAQLNKLMSGELEKTSEAAKAAALEKDRMAKMAQSAQSIMEKLNSTIHAFVIGAEPLIKAARWALETFLGWNKAVGGWLVPTLIGLFAVLKVGTGMLGINTSAIIANVAAKKSQTIANLQSLGPQKASTAATSASVGPTLALGAALLMVGAGIGMAAFGFSKLAESIKGLEPGQLLFLGGMFVAMAVGIGFLAKATILASPGMLAFGGAILMIGAGIAVAAAGIGFMAQSLTGISGMAGDLLAVAAAIAAIAAAAWLINPLSALGFSLMMMSVASSSREIAKAEGGITNFKEVVEVSSKIETTAVENVERLIESAKEYTEAQQEAAASPFDPFLKLLQGTTAGGDKKAAAAGPGSINVTLQLDGRVLDKKIINLVEEKFRPGKQ